MAEGRLDSLPGNHSPYFAPVVEPTLTTGIKALTLAARTWLGTGAPHQGGPATVQVRHQAADPVTAARAPGGGQGTS